MCETCNVEIAHGESEARPTGPLTRHGPVTRRGLLTTFGAGVIGATVLGTARAANAATLKNGAWCNPARGYFPDGGYYGAPRNGGGHAGQDITNSTGTAIYAAAAGTVVRREWGGGLPWRTGYGIVISHGNGTYTYYGHLSRYRVSLSQWVSTGQRIGDMGATGNVTGPHLHFETHYGGLGDTTNPVPFMAARGVDLGGGWSTLDPGSRGERVKTIQHLLNQRGYGLYVDGYYGAVTTDAVKQFQAGAGLYVDGQVGPKTWSKLVLTLREGHYGHHVRGLQTILNTHDANLTVDGIFGSVTDSAVRYYQDVNQLYVDGIAGKITWSALVG